MKKSCQVFAATPFAKKCEVFCSEMLWDAQRGLLFVHVPKAGGSVVRSLMLDSRPALAAENPEPLAAHVRAVDLAACSPADLSARGAFAVVRSPWDRAASAYLYLLKVGDQGYATRYYARRLARAGYRSPEDFGRFVKELLPTAALSWPVFVPQARFINGPDGATLVEDVLKYETAAGAGREELLRVLGASHDESCVAGFHLPSRNVDVAASLLHAEGHYCGLYNAEAAATVADVYREDVAQFGYEWRCGGGAEASGVPSCLSP